MDHPSAVTLSLSSFKRSQRCVSTCCISVQRSATSVNYLSDSTKDNLLSVAELWLRKLTEVVCASSDHSVLLTIPSLFLPQLLHNYSHYLSTANFPLDLMSSANHGCYDICQILVKPLQTIMWVRKVGF